MSELKIVGWTNFDSCYPMPKLSREKLGEVLLLLRNEIIGNNYIFGGQEHQNAPTGVPVFSDGTCFRASMRAWGHLMSVLYCASDGKQLSYMDFYMSIGDDTIMPKYTEIDVEPAVIDEEYAGCTIKADLDFIEQSKALGISAMTTDKVIQKLLNE